MARQPKANRRPTVTYVHNTRKASSGEPLEMEVTDNEKKRAAFERSGWTIRKNKTEKPAGVEKVAATNTAENAGNSDQQKDGDTLPGNKPGRPARV
jgi:hypothetical protein